MKIKLAIIAIVSAFSISAQAATIGSTAGIKAEILPSGNFDTGASEGGLGLSFLDKEWVNWGTHSSWSWLSSSLTGSVNTLGSNPLGSTILASDGSSFVLNGFFGGLTFIQTMTLNNLNQLGVTVSMTNNTGKDITGVNWGVGLDPDVNKNYVGPLNTFDTFNTILGQDTDAAVSAFGYGQTLTLANTTTASAIDIAAYINAGDCCSPVDPAVAGALPHQVLGFNTNHDDSISLAYDIGTIGVGKTVSFGYSYTMAAVPEPETYAMLLAGLGLMGFVARRKGKQV